MFQLEEINHAARAHTSNGFSLLATARRALCGSGFGAASDRACAADRRSIQVDSLTLSVLSESI
jgi:hypothetical protein